MGECEVSQQELNTVVRILNATIGVHTQILENITKKMKDQEARMEKLERWKESHS